MGFLPPLSQVQKARQHAQAQHKNSTNVWRLPENHPQRKRYERRRKLMNKARYGKGGRIDRIADALGEIPILGDTALAPMRGLLKGGVKTFEATHDEKGGRLDIEDMDTEELKEVGGSIVKEVKGMKKGKK